MKMMNIAPGKKIKNYNRSWHMHNICSYIY